MCSVRRRKWPRREGECSRRKDVAVGCIRGSMSRDAPHARRVPDGKEVVMTEKSRIALAEAIGTLILVVAGPGTAVLATGGFFPSGSVGVLGVALAFGLGLMCAAYAIGS